jgi:TRAP-type transport system periplasmic protein
MIKKTLKSLMLATLLAGTAGAALAQDITLRATANSNENDEDYDGLVVFKNYVENASNGAIAVELFIGTQLCSKGDECLAGVATGPSTSTFPPRAARRVCSPTFRCSTCPT